MFFLVRWFMGLRQKWGFVVAVAEASRDSSGRRGKIRFRPQIGFVRENLVRRVARRSLEFSGPILECRRRAPTSEGCRRWCLVPPDAEPGSREFPAREMGAKGSASTHLGAVVRLSKRRAFSFPRLYANTNYYILAARANFASSSENSLAPRSLCPRRTANRH